MATTKATSPKSTQAPQAVMPVAVVPTASPATASPASPLFALTAKQPRNGSTKQGAKSGLGKNWHTAATVAPNTRAMAYAALQGLGATFTQAQALVALAPVVAGTSGTPRSYWAAFVASGYIAQA